MGKRGGARGRESATDKMCSICTSVLSVLSYFGRGSWHESNVDQRGSRKHRSVNHVLSYRILLSDDLDYIRKCASLHSTQTCLKLVRVADRASFC